MTTLSTSSTELRRAVARLDPRQSNDILISDLGNQRRCPNYNPMPDPTRSYTTSDDLTADSLSMKGDL